ncbi:MAG: DUF2177 family protein [Patescibacteria group bacterium]
MQTLILAAVVLPIMLVIDLLWLGVVGANFYKTQLGSLMRPDIVWPAAIAFYLIYAVAVAFFVIMPGITAQSVVRVLLTGAFFGLAAYAAYDLSNLATLKDWPLTVTLVDLVWGASFTAVSAAAAYLIATRFLGY